MASIIGLLTDPFGVGINKLASILGIVLNVILGSSIAIATVATIVSGIQFVMSQGDAKALDNARRYLTAAVMALTLSMMSFALKRVILNIVGGTVGDLPDY